MVNSTTAQTALTQLAIAHAPTRYAKTWTNTTISWKNLCQRLAHTTYTPETIEQFKTLPKTEQDQIKDIGGFVGGHLKNGHRRKGSCLNRSIITLDADYARMDLWDEILIIHEWTSCIYSTHKHTPANPRLRLLIPLARPISEEEYQPVARKIAALLNIDAFDDTTYEPTRLMYWPSTPKDGQYVFETYDGFICDPDEILKTYTDWRDASTWPVSSRQTKAIQASSTKQADPLTKTGIVGAFCRTYTVSQAIEQYLNHIYQPSTVENRWDYILGESTAGLVIYDDKYAYSHHATDPAGGRLLNAFDLVRVHLYGELDEDTPQETPTNRLPSYKAMQDLAVKDTQVKQLLTRERLENAAQDFTNLPAPDNEWLQELTVKRNGQIEDSLQNLSLIMEKDPNMTSIKFNQHRDGICVDGPLPWKQLKQGWSDTDMSWLKSYIEKVYGIYSPQKLKDALQIAATARAYHPIKDYLNALPAWDGQSRVDTLLADYLGAADTPYTRAVTRKTLTAAVARIYRPGIKFDSILILNGPQGIGKSTLFARLGGDWFTDAITLTDMKDKTGAEKLQGYWICELGELAGMRKTEVEVVKSFVSRQDDKYRAAYGVNVESHLRQSIIVGSTNAEDGFLRDVTGNRRFWPVKVGERNTTRAPWQLEQADIEQIWAEAKHYYKQGEKLYLTGDVLQMALIEQSGAMEADEREGLVQAYLDTLIPECWDELSIAQRRLFLNGENLSEFGGSPLVGERERRTVSNIEVWSECFERDPALMRPQDAYQIKAILERIDGWYKTSERVYIKPYGRQRIYRKIVS